MLLSQLAALINAELRGDPNCQITGIAALDQAKPGQISFINDAKFRPYLNTTQATAVILQEKYAADFVGNALIVADCQVAYAKIATQFAPKLNFKAGIHPTAIIGENCQIANSASIGAYCVLGDNVKIGENSILASNISVGENTVIGKNCSLWPQVAIYHGVTIGDAAIIHSGAVIGADGFGMANEKGKWLKIPQLGGVKIGNDVEIGANTTIDRGALNDTVIEDGVKLDNQIQIAHNVHIGAHTVIAGCAAIAGSVKIGKHCMFGGAAVIADHVDICDNVILIGSAAVERSITEAGIYGGSAATGVMPFKELAKVVVRVRHINDFVKRLQNLERVQNEHDGN